MSERSAIFQALAADPILLDQAEESSKRPTPIPVSEFYGPMGEFVRQLEPETEADPMALYVQALTIAGSIVGRRAYCEVRDTRHHPNLFVGIVGPTSGARKGLGGDSVTALGRAIDPKWADNCVVSGLSSGEFIVDRLILASLRKGPKSQSDISSLFHRNKSAGQILALLDGLKNGGKIYCRNQSTGGAPKTIWEIVGT